jgi:hypothetical protein
VARGGGSELKDTGCDLHSDLVPRRGKAPGPVLSCGVLWTLGLLLPAGDSVQQGHPRMTLSWGCLVFIAVLSHAGVPLPWLSYSAVSTCGVRGTPGGPRPQESRGLQPVTREDVPEGPH